MASRIAVSVMAAGSTIRELRVIGASAGASTSLGLLETALGDRDNQRADRNLAPWQLHSEPSPAKSRPNLFERQSRRQHDHGKWRRIAFDLMVAEHRSRRFDASSPNAWSPAA
jgi:hypothetical protein